MITFNDYRPGYHDLFTGYLAREHDWTADYATTITDTALEFLSVCAEHPGERLVSSDDVDQAVDTLMLDTELLRWVENLLGHAVIHVPSYAHDPIERMRQDTAYSITIAYMRERGTVDPHIWRDLSDIGCTVANCWTSCRVLAA
jgi:hypothetical protein